jgi:metallo-beta-lactamase family protein
MMDSAKIQARDAEYLTKQARKRNEKFEWKPLFDEQDVIQTMTQFVTVSYEREILVAPDVSVLFSDAGHILGSSTVRLRIHTPGQNENDSVDVVFSGDLGRPDRPIIRDPAPLPPADYLILESTYGDRLHEKSADVLPRLAAIVRQTVERGGRIVIPAFAVERTQDIVYYLHLLVQRNEIPKVPIYVDSPMATDATAIFKLHPECYDRETYEAFTARHQDPFGFASLHYIQSVAESKELNDGNDPMIIISASGMCESGRIQHHLLHTLADPRNTVLLVGFMARHTLGRKLQERAKEVRILDTTVPVRAHIEEINALSGHADYGEIRELVTAMSLDRLRRIFLVHGEDTALSHQKLVLEQAGVGSVEIVEYGSTYTLS